MATSEQRRLKGGWLNWAREQPGLCLGLGPAAGPAVPAAEPGLAAGTQRSASRADVRGGRRGKGGTSPQLRSGRGLSTPRSITSPNPGSPGTLPPSPAFAATLLGLAPHSAPGPSRGSGSVLPPGVSSARLLRTAARFQLLLDVLAVRTWKERMRPCSSDLGGVFSPKPPRISTLWTRDSI